jgi:hypothetical protein
MRAISAALKAAGSGLPRAVCRAIDWTIQGVLDPVVELVEEHLLVRLGGLAFGDVQRDAGDAHRHAVLVGRPAARLDPGDLSARPHDAVLDLEVLAAVDGLVDRRRPGRPVVGMDQGDDVLQGLERIVGADPENRPRAAAGGEAPAGDVEFPAAHPAGLEGKGQVLFGGARARAALGR